MDEVAIEKSQWSNLSLKVLAARRAIGTSTSISGQAVVEYILLLAIVVGLYSLLLNKLSDSNAIGAMKKPFTQEFAYTYRYGNAKARGQEDGGPTFIPQHHDLEKNFRIFINPPINE
jgi:hypothetical protein